MSHCLTIVMYHYVRRLLGSRYPRLKALDIENFSGQLDFIQRHYQVVTMEQVIAAVQGEADALPPQPLLLTFDDGYRDHFDYVLPLLLERGLQGSFFPPACSVREGKVLDVNKIHFILASVEKPEALVTEIFSALDESRECHGLLSNAEYFATLSRDSRYDGPEVTFIKRILQKGLPQGVRGELTDRLFRRFVTQDEQDFAGTLYMNSDQLRALHAAGMCLGSHGDQHLWLNTLSPSEQRREVEVSLDFLTGLGVPRHDWVMCYPYGGYNEMLLTLLREKGCALGLSVEVALADLTHGDPLCLPRVDTNDLPSHREAVAMRWPWVRKALFQGGNRERA